MKSISAAAKNRRIAVTPFIKQSALLQAHEGSNLSRKIIAEFRGTVVNHSGALQNLMEEHQLPEAECKKLLFQLRNIEEQLLTFIKQI
jgi:hypothetical protein